MHANYLCTISSNSRDRVNLFLKQLENEFYSACSFGLVETNGDFEFNFELHLDDKSEIEYPVVDFVMHWISGYIAGNNHVFDTTI